jgi:hypothetical protein
MLILLAKVNPIPPTDLLPQLKFKLFSMIGDLIKRPFGDSFGESPDPERLEP